MTSKMGENITREWQNDYYPDDVFDALEMLRCGNCQGLDLLDLAEKKGSILAKMYLGCYLLEGDYGLKKDIDSGKFYLNDCFENGSIEAGYWLGFQYVKEVNYDNSLETYNILQSKNYGPAIFHHALIYYWGEISEKDLNRCLYLLNLAFRNGHLRSLPLIDKILLEGNISILRRCFIYCRKILYLPIFIYYQSFYPNSDRLRT